MRPVLLVSATLVAVAASVTIAAATQITYDFTAPGALQTFTAPFTGQFDIISVGASGGASSVPTTPGDGAAVAGFFNLTQGANLTIASVIAR